MQKTLIFILSTYFYSAGALAYGQTSLFCPHSVSCNSNDPKSCYLPDNPYDLWGKPELVIHKGSIHGHHQLASVQANSKDDDYKNRLKEVTCYYYTFYIDKKYPGQKSVSIQFSLYLKNPKNIYFKKQVKSDSLWNDGGNCSSTNLDGTTAASSCPMVQASGISMLENSSVTLFYPNPKAYFEPNYISAKWLKYEQLYRRCGATSNCIIDIGVCDTDSETCKSYGSVDLDISNKDIVKINQVNNSQDNPYTFKQKQPFNIIQIDSTN